MYQNIYNYNLDEIPFLDIYADTNYHHRLQIINRFS